MSKRLPVPEPVAAVAGSPPVCVITVTCASSRSRSVARLSASDTGAVAVAFTDVGACDTGRAPMERPRADDVHGAGPWEETRQKNGRAWSGSGV
ncbi:hypothetical protein GCM10009574_039090 [Streptomyces asiaticus]|uniref:Uncharacterized protein n=2 Tax=Streptomyces rhizosphaericus TaxID=114699 RepID=A0ABN1SCU0_9ACTN